MNVPIKDHTEAQEILAISVRLVNLTKVVIEETIFRNDYGYFRKKIKKEKLGLIDFSSKIH